MHFSIPDTQNMKDENGTTYKAFNVHVNGVLHCVVRYSQLYDLNNKLKMEFGEKSLPPFPPKRFRQVKGIDLEERKLNLEKYIQAVSQDSQLSSCDGFVTFLCRAQQETQREESIPISFDVFLMNWSKLTVDISSTDQTNDVLENVMSSLGITKDLTFYFGLFLIKCENKGRFSIIRKLQEFECPYISLKCLHERRSYKIVVRKSYWDQSLDEIVAADPVGLNLLNIEAECDIKIGWIHCSDEINGRLKRLKAKDSKHEYLRLCQTLDNYGYIHFNSCMTDFPKKGSRCSICAGNYQLIFKVLGTDDVEEEFSVTRMKCWRVSSQFNAESTSDVDQPMLQLSFEYLVSNNSLKWISLISDQAIMLSMCIKSMVDELIRTRKGENMKKPIDRTTSSARLTFKPRDKTTEVFFQPSDIQSDDDSTGTLQKAKESVKKITEKLSVVSILSKPDNLQEITIEHQMPTEDSVKSIFEGIGDDDL